MNKNIFMITRMNYVEYLISTPINYACSNLAKHLDNVSHDVVTDYLRNERLTARNMWELTEPKWKGRIAIESTDAEWMGGLVNSLGEQRGMTFFRKLSEQKPDVRKGHILLAQMVAAGETDVGLTIYNATAQSLKQRGAPIDWVPIEPTLARPQGVGVARNAPHPHAAALLADFILSPEAQTLLNSMGRPPANQKVKSNLNNFNYVMTDPSLVVDEAEKWNQHWTRLFLTK